MPGNERLVAQAVVQRQAAVDLPTVLAIEAGELAPQVQELAGGLAKGGHIAQQEAGDGVVGDVCIEGEQAGLLEEVVYVHLRDLAVESEGQVVVAHLPVQVIAQGVVGAGEVSLRISTQGEEAGHRDLVNLLECRLPDVDTKISDVDRAWQRTAVRILKLIAQHEVVQQPAGEGMRLRDQGVVVMDVRLVRIGEQILQVQHSGYVVGVGEVTCRRAVVRAQILIEACRHLTQTVEVWQDEGEVAIHVAGG